MSGTRPRISIHSPLTLSLSKGVFAIGVTLIAGAAAGLTPADVDRGAQFSTPRVRGLVRQLAGNGFLGRDNGTAGSEAAQRVLIAALRKVAVGLGSGAGDDAFRQPFVQDGKPGTNLFAVIRGRELPDEYVFVGGHYDHLGRNCRRASPADDICNGATDNAAGTAAVLAVARGLRSMPAPPRRSVVLALWDAEEDGLAGSLYYVNHPIVPLERTIAYVNLDLIGANLLPSVRNASFAVGAETGGATLRALTEAAIGATSLRTRLVSYIFGQGRSDYANFVTAGVPTVFFGDSTGPCYHTPDDEIVQVDFRKLKLQGQIAFRLTQALAEDDTVPAFSPTNPALGTFEDAVVVSDLLTQGLVDFDRFPPADQTLLRDRQGQLAAIVRDGPGQFDSGDIITTLSAALDAINALTRLPCLPP